MNIPVVVIINVSRQDCFYTQGTHTNVIAPNNVAVVDYLISSFRSLNPVPLAWQCPDETICGEREDRQARGYTSLCLSMVWPPTGMLSSASPTLVYNERKSQEHRPLLLAPAKKTTNLRNGQIRRIYSMMRMLASFPSLLCSKNVGEKALAINCSQSSWNLTKLNL